MSNHTYKCSEYRKLLGISKICPQSCYFVRFSTQYLSRHMSTQYLQSGHVCRVATVKTHVCVLAMIKTRFKSPVLEDAVFMGFVYRLISSYLP